MNVILLRLYAYLLAHYGPRADIRIDCSQVERVTVWVLSSTKAVPLWDNLTLAEVEKRLDHEGAKSVVEV
jgi:hypothetical protein